MDKPDLRVENQLCFALYSASRAMTAAYRAPLAELGLTYPQYLVILALWERDDQRVHELGRMLQLDSGTLSPLLRRLESLGMVRRHRDPDDERSVIVSLDEKGQELRAHGERVQACVIDWLPMPLDDALRLRDLARELTGGMPLQTESA